MPSYKIKKGATVNIKEGDKNTGYEYKALSGDNGDSVELSPQDALAHLDVLDVDPAQVAKDIKSGSGVYKEPKKESKKEK